MLYSSSISSKTAIPRSKKFISIDLCLAIPKTHSNFYAQGQYDRWDPAAIRCRILFFHMVILSFPQTSHSFAQYIMSICHHEKLTFPNDHPL